MPRLTKKKAVQRDLYVLFIAFLINDDLENTR